MKKPILAICVIVVAITVFMFQFTKAQTVETHDYLIIEAPNAVSLATNVNKYLNKGYLPAGGFIIESGKFQQALYK